MTVQKLLTVCSLNEDVAHFLLLSEPQSNKTLPMAGGLVR